MKPPKLTYLLIALVFILSGAINPALALADDSAPATSFLGKITDWLSGLRHSMFNQITGRVVGDSCSTDDECTTGEYCGQVLGSGVCCPTGETCCIDSQECPADKYCEGKHYGTIGICDPRLSLGETCRIERECIEGLYCADNVCAEEPALVRIGQTCRYDTECETGNCGPMEEGSINICCASGGTCCNANYPCPDGYECNGIDAICEQLQLKSDGEMCSSGSECSSGNCQNGRCCPSGKTCCTEQSQCASDEYCHIFDYYCKDKLQDGTACSTDTGLDLGCLSGNCYDGICCEDGKTCCASDNDCDPGQECGPGYYCITAQTQAKSPDGSLCTYDEDCESDWCGGICCQYPETCCKNLGGGDGSGGSSLCGWDQWCDASQFYCKEDLPDGTACGTQGVSGDFDLDGKYTCASDWCKNGICCESGKECCASDSDCPSGQVCGSDSYCAEDQQETQQSWKSNGESCSGDSECETGNCGNEICCSYGKTCCDSDYDCEDGNECGNNYYCIEASEKLNGESCSGDSDCASGNCRNSICCTYGETCCDSYNDCDYDDTCGDNHYCIEYVECTTDSDCETDSFICTICDSGHMKCYNNACFDCRISSHCISGYICENHICVVGEETVTKKSNGESCSSDTECKSGNCDYRVCCTYGKTCCTRTPDSCTVGYYCGNDYYCIAMSPVEEKEECAPDCNPSFIGDGRCHFKCDVPACNFDDGDCKAFYGFGAEEPSVKKELGKDCTFNHECFSGNCRYVCCKTGETCCEHSGDCPYKHKCGNNNYCVIDETYSRCGDGRCGADENCLSCKKDCLESEKSCCVSISNIPNEYKHNTRVGEFGYCCMGDIQDDPCDGYKEKPEGEFRAALFPNANYFNRETKIYEYPGNDITLTVVLTNKMDEMIRGSIRIFDSGTILHKKGFSIRRDSEKNIDIDFTGEFGTEYNNIFAKITYGIGDKAEKHHYTTLPSKIKTKEQTKKQYEKKDLNDIINLQEKKRSGIYRTEVLILDQPFKDAQIITEILGLIGTLSGDNPLKPDPFSLMSELLGMQEHLYVVSSITGKTVPALIADRSGVLSQRNYREGDMVRLLVSTKIAGLETNPGILTIPAAGDIDDKYSHEPATKLGTKRFTKIKYMKTTVDISGYGFITKRKVSSDKKKVAYMVTDFDNHIWVDVSGISSVPHFKTGTLIRYEGQPTYPNAKIEDLGIIGKHVSAYFVEGMGNYKTEDFKPDETAIKTEIGIGTVLPLDFVKPYNNKPTEFSKNPSNCFMTGTVNDLVILYGTDDARAAAGYVRDAWSYATTVNGREEGLGEVFSATFDRHSPQYDEPGMTDVRGLTNEQENHNMIYLTTSNDDNYYLFLEDKLTCRFRDDRIYDPVREKYFDSCINIIKNYHKSGTYIVAVLAKNKDALNDARKFISPAHCSSFRTLLNANQDYYMIKDGEIY